MFAAASSHTPPTWVILLVFGAGASAAVFLRRLGARRGRSRAERDLRERHNSLPAGVNNGSTTPPECGYAYGDFLRAIREEPGFRLQLVSCGALAAALASTNGVEYALIVVACTLAGCLTLGYPIWRWIARRRGRPY